MGGGYALGTFVGMVPYDCAAIYFGTVIDSIDEFDELSEDPVVLAVSIVGMVAGLVVTVVVGCVCRRKLDEVVVAEGGAVQPVEPVRPESRPASDGGTRRRSGP